MEIDGELNMKNIKKTFAKKGIYYTPKELAEYMLSLVDTPYKTAYDPTIGQGNLLAILSDDIEKYGQEIHENEMEKARAKLKNFTGVVGDTLAEPAFMDKKFDLILANPPFSVEWKPVEVTDPRFKDCGIVPTKGKADYAFILHCLYLLAEKGTAVIMNFPGILYRKGREGKIRQWLVEQNYVDKVIELPGKKFTDTDIQTILLVLKKNKKDTDILFIDEEDKEVRKVKLEEIKENDFNLSVSTYIEKEMPEIDYDPETDNSELRKICLLKLIFGIQADAWVTMFNGYKMKIQLMYAKRIIEKLEEKHEKDPFFALVNAYELLEEVIKEVDAEVEKENIPKELEFYDEEFNKLIFEKLSSTSDMLQ